MSLAGPSKRPDAPYAALPKLSAPFALDTDLARNYKTQYANIYFLRLLRLRGIVAKRAKERWEDVKGESQPHTGGELGG